MITHFYTCQQMSSYKKMFLYEPSYVSTLQLIQFISVSLYFENLASMLNDKSTAIKQLAPDYSPYKMFGGFVGCRPPEAVCDNLISTMDRYFVSTFAC